ncbi:MAG: hypothetical protein K2J48_03970 [Muribaculaceae bacterium]|nr:hypothetical protein [Muribaculaceae bacterium]
MRKYLKSLIKAFISGALLARFAKVLKYFFNHRRPTMPSSLPETHPESKDSIDMVCWLTTLAQPYIRVIAPTTSYRFIQRANPLEFTQIKVEIKDWEKMKELNEDEICKHLTFIVEIHSLAYREKWHNIKRIEFRDWLNRKKKSQIIEKEIDQKQFIENLDRAQSGKKGNLFKPSFELRLSPMILHYRLVDCLPCGIAKFSISKEDTSEIALMDLVDLMGKDIFNILHLFFHEHHFHEIVNPHNEPFYPCQDIDLRKPNNEAIDRFITQMGNGLADKVDEAYMAYQEFLILEKRSNGTGRKKLKVRKKKKAIRDFYKHCDNLLGMHSFLNAILCSPQNTHWRLGRDCKSVLEEKRMEMAAIIENSHRGTEALLRKISHHHDDKQFSKSMKWAFVGIWVSVFMGIVGVLMSIDSFKEWCSNAWEWCRNLIG